MKVPEKRKLNGRGSALRTVRALLALAAVALVGLLAAQTASGALFVPRSQAAAGDEVNFRISQTQPGDEYRLLIGDNELVKGIDEDGDQLESKFTMPNLGDAEQTVTIDMEVTRVGSDLIRDSHNIRYVLAGPTGPTGPTDPVVADAPAAVAAPSAPAARRTPKAPKANTGPTGGDTKSQSKPESGSGKKGGSNKNDSPSYVAPKVDTPLTLRAGGGGNDLGSNTATPRVGSLDGPGPQLPEPSAPAPTAVPPPGIAGAGGVTATPPPTAPIAPTAAVDNSNNGFDLPLWLVAVLGLVMLAGLGGAEARLLGLWGTPVAGDHSPDEARLLALARAARSGATVQEGIATRKGVRGNGSPTGKNGGRLKV